MPQFLGKETKKTLKTLETRTIMPPVFGESNQKVITLHPLSPFFLYPPPIPQVPSRGSSCCLARPAWSKPGSTFRLPSNRLKPRGEFMYPKKDTPGFKSSCRQSKSRTLGPSAPNRRTRTPVRSCGPPGRSVPAYLLSGECGASSWLPENGCESKIG